MRARASLLIRVLASGLALPTPGCGPSVDDPDVEREEPRRYAEAVCEALDACGCYTTYASRDECEQEYIARLAPLLDLGLAYDSSCFEQVLGSDAVNECELESVSPFATQCVLLEGDTGAGGECRQYYGVVPPFQVDVCAGDLVCRGGRCREPDEPLPAATDGSPCETDEIGALCPSALEEHLYCSEEGVCRTQVEPGSACVSPFQCRSTDLPGYYCEGLGDDGVGSCQPKKLTGEPCAPGDIGACAYDADQKVTGWCDAQTSACVTDFPAICTYPTQQ